MKREVAVIIPMYNAAGTVVRTLDSVLKQSYPVYEIIVVDDQSTDESKLLVEDFFRRIQTPRLTLIQNETNAGPGSSRNRGIDVARSAILAFIDADDVWHPRHLENSMTLLEKYGIEDSVVVQQPVERFDEAEAGIRYHFFKPLYYFFIQKNCSIITLVASRSLILKAGAFPERRSYGEDYQFFIRLFLQAGFCLCIDGPRTALVGKHPFASQSGLSSKRFKMYIGTLRSTTTALVLTPYVYMIPLLIIWHTIKYGVRWVRVVRYQLAN